MRVCEQCQVAQFNGKWHCSEKEYFLSGNKLYQFKATKYAKSCRTVPSGTVQKPRFYAGLSPTVPFPSLKPRANGFCAVPRGGHTSPLFLKYEKAGRWCPVGTVQRRPRRQPRPTVLATPLGPWSSAPHLAAFEKAGKTFTCLSQTQARAACSPPSAGPAALKRRARIECPGTERGLLG